MEIAFRRDRRIWMIEIVGQRSDSKADLHKLLCTPSQFTVLVFWVQQVARILVIRQYRQNE